MKNLPKMFFHSIWMFFFRKLLMELEKQLCKEVLLLHIIATQPYHMLYKNALLALWFLVTIPLPGNIPSQKVFSSSNSSHYQIVCRIIWVQFFFSFHSSRVVWTHSIRLKLGKSHTHSTCRF